MVFWPAKTEWWGKQSGDWLGCAKEGKLDKAVELVGRRGRFGNICVWVMVWKGAVKKKG